MLRQATKEEIRQFYHEEYTTKEIPEYILENLHQREFAFDRAGKGPRDRFNQFNNTKYLERIIKAKMPYAAYTSIAQYDNPQKREGWTGAEFVIDVDAKDNPLRTCTCKTGQICPECLDEAKQIILKISDNLSMLGFNDIHYVYSGRGYHIRCQDDELIHADGNTRSEIVNYCIGAEVPELEEGLQHFTIPFGYPQVYTEWFKYTVNHLQKDKMYTGLNRKLKLDIIKRREQINQGLWGLVRGELRPTRYDKLLEKIANIQKGLCDTKVSIDTKRILRLPSSLHYKVSMKCMAVRNIETFDPFSKAVPKFVAENN
jgi:DNA primase small subunit